MKRIIITALSIVALSFMAVVTAPEVATVFADAKKDVCQGLQSTGAGANCAAPAGPSVETVIKAVINVLSWVVGVISLIMIIVGGFKYVTSGGDSSSTQSAKNTIIYALVGLIIVAFSQTIIRFVIEKLL